MVPPEATTDSEAVPPAQRLGELAEVVNVSAAGGAGRMVKLDVLAITSPEE